MCESKYVNKIIITMQEMMEQMHISDKTLLRMIEENDLPDFTYGSKYAKKKGWHTAGLFSLCAGILIPQFLEGVAGVVLAHVARLRKIRLRLRRVPHVSVDQTPTVIGPIEIRFQHDRLINIR